MTLIDPAGEPEATLRRRLEGQFGAPVVMTEKSNNEERP